MATFLDRLIGRTRSGPLAGWRPLLSAALVLLALGSGCSRGPSSERTAQKGPAPASTPPPSAGQTSRPAPDFTLLSTAGDSVRMASLKGKVVLVDFWATWCPPCRAEIPHLADLYRKYKSRGLEIVGVADDPREHDKVAPFVRKNRIPYPVAYGQEGLGDAFGGFYGYPTVFVVDRRGQVVQKFEGYTDERNLEVIIQQLLS